jgi:3-deoxy-D-manno-octulosonic-acid transferase
VGEGLQAGAVLAALLDRRPDLQAAFTHFSPSAEGLGDRLGASVSAYLPWDVAEPVRDVLDEMRPDLLVFTKTEVWPVLVEQAALRDIPVAIVGAVVAEDAGRTRWPARMVLRPTWARLALACANSSRDAEQLVALGVDPSSVHVTGDPGIDSAARRVAEANGAARYLSPFRGSGRPTVVAGSTWPADEEVLARAWVGIRRDEPRALLIVVPHEPSAARVSGLLERLRGLGLTTVTLGHVERTGSANAVDAVVVDRVGVLAHLYTVADAAYVGGGFGRDGLHSVLEPAAAGIPATFGPRHGRARAAAELLQAGGARSAPDAASLEAVLRGWLRDPKAKSDAGARAKDYIGVHLGAAQHTAELLEPLIGAVGQA